MLHVSPGGDDAGDGSEQRPVATLAAVHALVRTIVADKSANEVRVEISAGIYRLAEPLVFTPADASPECAVTYVGLGDVVLSGGVEVAPWRSTGEVWEADVPPLSDDDLLRATNRPTIRDLWAGERRAVRERPTTATIDSRLQAPIAARASPRCRRRCPQLKNPDAAEVVYLHDWSISAGPHQVDRSRGEPANSPTKSAATWSSLPSVRSSRTRGTFSKGRPSSATPPASGVSTRRPAGCAIDRAMA